MSGRECSSRQELAEPHRFPHRLQLFFGIAAEFRALRLTPLTIPRPRLPLSMPVSNDFVARLTKSQRQLHAFIFSLVWNPADADDILQETNLVLLQKAEAFDGSRDFLPWALQFARFQTLAALKRQQRLRLVFDDALARTLADEATAAEPVLDARRLALATCLQKLPRDQRDLLVKRYEPAASVAGLAAAIRVTPKALSDRLRRIRQVLLECVTKTLAEEAVA
ncbi:MAG: sigma-70 family RNA polymerase sigma factor [Planctomycetia bacterium]|nr:sigma-70 family RNA polymerase sigma factor [Planctomycetia bacterium]